MARLEFSSPTVEVAIDNKATTLRLTIDGLAKLQEIWEVPDLAALQDRLSNMQSADMGDLLYVAMLFDQPETTPADGRKFANSLGLADLMEVVTRVVQASRPPPGAAQPGPQKPA